MNKRKKRIKNKTPDHIPDRVKEKIDKVLYYAKDELDWLKIRKEIISSCHPSFRSYFGRRHDVTLKTILTDFDYLVKDYWEDKAKTKVFIDEARLHDEEEYKHDTYSLYKHIKKRMEKADK